MWPIEFIREPGGLLADEGVSRYKQKKTINSPQAAPACCFSRGSVSTIRLLEHDMTVISSANSPETAKTVQQTRLTRINRKIHRVNRRHGHDDSQPSCRITTITTHKRADNLARKAQHQQTQRHYHRAHHHQRSTTAPTRRALVGNDAHNRLHDQARQRPCNPDQTDIALAQAKVEEIRRAVCESMLAVMYS